MDPGEQISDINSMCRTCLLATGQHDNELQSIYETTDNKAVCIAEMLINSVPQLTIEPTDALPKTICNECLEKLLHVQQFQQMCIASDNHIRDLLACNTADAEEEKYCSTNEAIPETTVSVATSADPLQDDLKMYLKLEIEEEKLEDIAAISLAAIQHSSAGGSDEDDNDEFVDDDDDDEDWDETNEPSLSGSKRGNDEIEEGTQLDESESKRKHKKILRKAMPCEECGKLFAGAYRLNRHMKVHKATNKPHVCEICKYRFTSSSHLSRHTRRQHDNRESYSCDLCPSRFVREIELYQHKQTTHNVSNRKNNTCEFCNRKFRSANLFEKHKLMHLGAKEVDLTCAQKPYMCEYCNKAFQQSCTLKDHLRTHTGEQPYLCSECGRAFNSSSNMKQHLLRHTGVKRYECPDCPKKFPCLSDLASHKAVHNKVKPHVCDVCGAAFGKPYQLKKHKMYHNNDKPHKCEYCDMRFVCADHMRRHMRTHTGEKPYACKYCSRAFAQSNDMIKHLRSHLGENIYKCELCPLSFRLAAELREHFATHKNDDEETRQRNLQALMEEDAKLRIQLPSRVPPAGRPEPPQHAQTQQLISQEQNHEQISSVVCI